MESFFSGVVVDDDDDVDSVSSLGASTPAFSNSSESSPDECIDIRISHPPTNSLLTYSWGIVGHEEYSLIPTDSKKKKRTAINTHTAYLS